MRYKKYILEKIITLDDQLYKIFKLKYDLKMEQSLHVLGTCNQILLY